MAKKRKLNRRVIALLAILGCIFIAVIVANVVIPKLRPKDPKQSIARGKAALENQEYQKAIKDFSKAVEDEPGNMEFRYKLADALYQYSLQPNMTQSLILDNRKKAVDVLDKVLIDNPNDTKALKLMADITLNIDPVRFLSTADKLLALEPDNKTIRLHRAQLRMLRSNDLNNRAEAKSILADFDKILKQDPHDLECWNWLIEFYKRANRVDSPERIQQCYTEAIKQNPKAGSLYVSYANFLFQQNEPEKSEKQIRLAMEKDPDNPIGYLAMAEYDIRNKRYDQAFALLQKAQQIDPTNAQPYYQMARLAQIRGDFQKSADYLRQGIKVVEQRMATTTAPARTQRLTLMVSRQKLEYELANLLIDQARRDPQKSKEYLDEAAKSVEQLNTLAPKSAWALQADGYLAYARGNLRKALSSLEKANELNPDDLITLNRLVEIYLSPTIDMPGKAGTLLETWITRHRGQESPMVFLNLARIALREQNYVRAEQLLDSALPKMTDTRYEAYAKNLQKALQFLLKNDYRTLPKFDMDFEVRRMLLERAITLGRNEDKTQAIRLLDLLHQRLPKDMGILQLLAQTLFSDGKLEQAKHVLESALATNPDNKSIQNMLAFISTRDPKKQFQIQMAQTDEIEDKYLQAMQRASICRKFNKEDAFKKYLAEAEAIKPDSLGVLEERLSYAIEKKDWKTAEECVRQAAGNSNFSSNQGKWFAAQLAFARQDWEKAISLLTDFLSDSPDSKAPRIMLGQCYLNSGDVAKAEESFQYVLNNDEGYEPAVVGMAQVTERQGKWQEHRKWVQRAIQLGINNAYIQDQALAIQEENAKGPELQKIIQKREQRYQANPGDIANLLRLALLYERAGEYDKAGHLYRRLYETATGKSKLGAARILVDFYVRTNQSSEADKVFAELRKTEKDKVPVYLLYGQYLFRYDRQQAEKAFAKALELEPNNAQALLAMAQFQEAQKNWPAAISVMEDYLKLHPNNRDAALKLIQYYATSGHINDAQTRLNDLLKKDPENIEALRIKALLAAQQGHPDEAEKIYNDILITRPNYAPVLLDRARVFWAEGQAARAKSDIRLAIQSSSDANIAQGAAILLVYLRSFDEAQAVLQNQIENNPGNVAAIRLLIQIYLEQKKWVPLEELLASVKARFPKDPQYWLDEANMYYDRGDYRRQVATLAKALNIFPDSPGVLASYLNALSEVKEYAKIIELAPAHRNTPGIGPDVCGLEALALAKLNKPIEADKLFLSALTNSQTPWSQLLHLVAWLDEAYGTKGAINKMVQWTRLNPENWRLSVLLGSLYVRDNDAANAEKAFTRAKQLAPRALDKIIVEQNMGRGLYAIAMTMPADQAKPLLKKVERSYQAVLETLPNDVETLNNLAYMLTDQMNDPEKAEPLAKEAVKLDPSNGSILDTYAWTLARLGKYKEAEEYLNRAIQQDEPRAAYRYHLGYVYEKTNRTREALNQYQQAREMTRDNPNNPLYAKIVTAIQRLKK